MSTPIASPLTDDPNAAPPLVRAVDFFETLTPAALVHLDRVFTDDARFKDPFHEVQGLSAIRAIFEHMHQQLDQPRFVVHDRLGDARQGFVTWVFTFRWRGQRQPRPIRGCTHWRFAPDGRISEHRDYWDAAEELYEQWPGLGACMRWLKRRAAAPLPR
ncbi:MAG: nuclear transport factor 2 family protein [Tepidimonas ignava]|uniref:nuclear transport factor 2 family protein n=1 Tax=Tepidimonas ignava TaxID=114249 RepID=UPI002A3250FF|nr:nuclear transport factor 2 family protein [Tepidimonas ignava]